MPEILSAVRVVASPEALAGTAWPEGATVLPLAPDEVLVLGAESLEVADPHALIAPDESLSAVELTRRDLEAWLAREAEWQMGDARFAQGMVAGLPVKVLAEGDRAMVLTRTSLRHDLEERL